MGPGAPGPPGGGAGGAGGGEGAGGAGAPGGAGGAAREVRRCAFAGWAPRFPPERGGPRARVLELPEGFSEWLLADGLSLPGDSDALYTRGEASDSSDSEGGGHRDWEGGGGEGGGSGAAERAGRGARSSSSSSSCGSEGSGGGAPGGAGFEETAVFADFRRAVDAAIAELGGAVTPKLNWSSPKDTAWLNPTRTLRCENADTVFLMLRASDRIAHDLCHAFDGWEGDAEADGARGGDLPFTLVLKKWYDLKPGREFRCFVARGGALRGISQRDVTQHFPELAAQACRLRNLLEWFHAERVEEAFPAGGDPYTYDVYVTSGDRLQVRLLDFNPAGGTTSPLLFAWDELELRRAPPPRGGGGEGGGGEEEEEEEGGGAAPELRLVPAAGAARVQPGEAALMGVPFDLVDASPEGALQGFLQRVRETEATQ